MVAVQDKLKGGLEWVQSSAFHMNYYRAHLSFFVIAILVSSAIFWAANTSGFEVGYTDALFLCASAMTSTGLNTVNLSEITAYQQSILFVLMALGDLSIVSVSVVYVRRYFFGRKIRSLLKHSKAAQRLAQDIEEGREHRNTALAEGNANSGSSSAMGAPHKHHAEENANGGADIHQNRMHILNAMVRRRHAHRHGYGGFPTPWETETWRKYVRLPDRFHKQPQPSDHHYLSFEPELDRRGRFRNLTSEQLAELGGVEYRALGVLEWLLPLYSLTWLCLIWVILIPWSTKNSTSSTVRTAQPGNTNPQWWAAFVGLSSYSNCGLDLLDSSMQDFAHDYLVLIVTGATILAGNTFYPIFLRLWIWFMSLFVPRHSQLHHSFSFLLHHPRRCFLFLFPKKNTWYLVGVQVTIFLLLWLAFEILNLGYDPVLSTIPDPGQRTMDGLYQAHGVRSSGFYIITQSSLSPACQVFFMVNMYISAIPFIVSLRSTNIYEERSIGMPTNEDADPEKQSKNEKESASGQPGGSGPSVQTHLQNQLAYDLWWIVLAVFLIAIIERTPLATPNPGFSLFSIIFEVVSAYGTVGLSLGVPYDNYSFSGAWRKLSKLILVTVMLRGRHRILPLAVDRAVLIPGQELMERMDREHTGVPGFQHYEAKIREEEEGVQAEKVTGGEQDPERGKIEGNDDKKNEGSSGAKDRRDNLLEDFDSS
ncbi:MAG: hypothetical protein M1822_000632 [Bathelium mastoideum]|nr:MAG: hypothetical protein M1822_000632 [Bathelium mastoideum]